MNFGMIRTLGFRHWFAWQIVRLAWYIYHDDTREEIALLNGDEEVAAWTIDGDSFVIKTPEYDITLRIKNLPARSAEPVKRSWARDMGLRKPE